MNPAAAQLSVLMAGLRGANIDSSDFADNDVVMQLISVSDSDGESLPLTYDPQMISEYWGRRPVSVLTRLAQLGGGRRLSTLNLNLQFLAFLALNPSRALGPATHFLCSRSWPSWEVGAL